MKLAGFLDVENFAPLIVSALRTRAVGHFLLVAVGTFGKAMTLQKIMGAPSGGALLGMTSFWIGHGIRIPLQGIFTPKILPGILQSTVSNVAEC